MSEEVLERYSPVFGIILEFVFYKPDEERTERLMKWQSSFTPSQNFIINARRRFSFAFSKLVMGAGSGEAAAKLIDYLGNSYHLDEIEKLVKKEECKEAYINIMGMKKPFIMNGEVCSGGILKQGQELISHVLGSRGHPDRIIVR